MNAASLTIRAAMHIFNGDQPIIRTPQAEDAYYAAHGGRWIETIAPVFALVLLGLAGLHRVTIVPSPVKFA